MRVLGFIALATLDVIIVWYGLRWQRESLRRYRETGVIWYRGVRYEGRHAWIGAAAASVSTFIVTGGLLIALVVLAFKLFG